jgi:hypothetical protein
VPASKEVPIPLLVTVKVVIEGLVFVGFLDYDKIVVNNSAKFVPALTVVFAANSPTAVVTKISSEVKILAAL